MLPIIGTKKRERVLTSFPPIIRALSSGLADATDKSMPTVKTFFTRDTIIVVYIYTLLMIGSMLLNKNNGYWPPIMANSDTTHPIK